MGANTFIWYELMTTDAPAAEAFYGAVVGWQAEAWAGPNPYTVMKAGGRGVAGVMPLPDAFAKAGGQPCWLGYVAVDDVDAAAEAVKRAGGTIHRSPDDIPEVGRFAAVADPQGAVFFLFKPFAGDDAPAAADAPGHVGWRELYAADWSRAFDFYAGQFGWTKAEAIPIGPLGTYQIFAADGVPVGGMMNKPEVLPRPVWLFYFNVPEIGAATSRITEAGGAVVMGPHEVPGGSWIVQGQDPQGAMFALVAPRR